MKITIATGPIFPVPAVRGGAVQRMWEGLAREFVKRGHEVTMFAREFPGQPREETLDGIRYVRCGGYAQSTSIKRDLLQCLLYALKTARHVPPGDVVVTNDFWMPAVLPWLKRSPGKIVVNANRFPKKQYWLYRNCAAIAAVSGAVAAALKEQTPSLANKVAVVPNAIDEVFLKETKGIRDQETKRPEDDGTTGRVVKILYVGRIHPEKGLVLLASALKSLQQNRGLARWPRGKAGSGEQEAWECVLVGPVAAAEGGGGEAFAGRLSELTKGLPVTIEPPVYGTKALAALYDTGDILVYPSAAELGEAMPLAPLEAMARGLVPVVSDLPVFREYLEPGVNGLVFAHRDGAGAANLARALGDLVADCGRRERLGEAARTTAQKFSPAAVAEQYLQLFGKLAFPGGCG